MKLGPYSSPRDINFFAPASNGCFRELESSSSYTLKTAVDLTIAAFNGSFIQLAAICTTRSIRRFGLEADLQSDFAKSAIWPFCEEGCHNIPQKSALDAVIELNAGNSQGQSSHAKALL